MPDRRDAALLALCAGASVVEVGVIRGIGLVSTLPLAGQAMALPPIAAFADVRWILVYADNWPALAGEVLVDLVLRSVVVAAALRLAWPGGAPPPWRKLIARAGVGWLVLLGAMSPWAVTSYATAVGSIAYPLAFGAVCSWLIGVLVLPHAAAGARWWVRWPPWRAMAAVALDFLVVTAGAVAIDYSPSWVVLVSAAVVGALSGCCWKLLAVAVAPLEASSPGAPASAAAPAAGRWRRLGAAAGVVGVPALAVLVVCGLPMLAAAGVAWEGTPHIPRAAVVAADVPHRGDKALLMVDGLQSDWTGVPPSGYPGFVTSEFSYRGLGPHGLPLPYASTATVQSLPVLAARMAAQVKRLARLTGRRVDVLAVSEGTLVVRQYLADYRSPPLGVVVLSSPLPRPDRVYSPPAGRSAGFGLVATEEARALFDVSEDVVPGEDVTASAPLVRSLVPRAPLYRQRMLCPADGVRVVALLPLTAAADTPPGPVAGVPDGVLPEVHATLLDAGQVRRDVVGILKGRPLAHYFGWGLAFQVTRYAASAWEAPSLPLADVRTWRAEGGTRYGDAAFGTYGCPATTTPSARGPRATASVAVAPLDPVTGRTAR